MKFKRTKLILIIVTGGVGEFLFQLDLAKRFEDEGIATTFLIKKKYNFFVDLAQMSGLTQANFVSFESSRFSGAINYIWICIKHSVVVINSFNSLSFSFFTKMLYRFVRIMGGRVIITKKDRNEKEAFETIYYNEQEMIWERNQRLTEYIIGRNNQRKEFPILFQKFQKVENSSEYIHIHPVGSLSEKSYPVKKLIALFDLTKETQWLLTITPTEAIWYITPDLETYVQMNAHVSMKIQYFHAHELLSIMHGARVFCTVNTGLLWLACMNMIHTVVIDTYTDWEWNPSPYKGVTRLSHDYDSNGKSLHLAKEKHEDGIFFESMYLVQPEEIAKVISDIS